MISLRFLPARSEDHSGGRKTLYFLCGYILLQSTPEEYGKSSSRAKGVHNFPGAILWRIKQRPGNIILI
jgi:hypothetical protein